MATTTAIAPLGGDAGQPFAPLPQIPSYADEGDDVDALIADNAGNTISEDDPVVSGAQQVADRYNQLSASYGDAAELTAASYAITEEDRTGTIIDLTGTAPSEIQEDDSLASTALSISPLTNDDFSGPSLDAGSLIQDAANIPIDIGSAEEGEGGNETIKQVGENAEALATGTEGVGKAVDLNGVIAKLSGLKPLEELLDNTAHVLAPLATTFNIGARVARVATAPSGDGVAQTTGEASDFALNLAVDDLGATVGAGVFGGLAYLAGAAGLVAAAPIEAGLLVGAVLGAVGASLLYSAVKAPEYLQRFYYNPNGTAGAQRLPPEK